MIIMSTIFGLIVGFIIGVKCGYDYAYKQMDDMEALINDFLAETADEVIKLKRDEKGELREVKIHEHEIWQNEKGKMN